VNPQLSIDKCADVAKDAVDDLTDDE